LDTVSIGKHNPRLLDVRKAVQRGTLTSDGLLPIEGPRVIREAHASGLPLAALFVRDDVAVTDLPSATSVFMLDASTFKNLQSTEHSQGIIALVKPRNWQLADVFGVRAPIAVLAGLQDPGNVGTILRVAESFGAAGCLGLSGTASIHNSKVTRASAGSVFRLPSVWDLSWDEVVNALKSRGIPIVGTSPHATESIASWDWDEPAAVLIGNEGAGLAPKQAEACTAILKIPHEVQTESLNSAIAAAVVLYEAYRRRSTR
jgi:TrmH family RNA methyltransferase